MDKKVSEDIKVNLSKVSQMLLGSSKLLKNNSGDPDVSSAELYGLGELLYRLALDIDGLNEKID